MAIDLDGANVYFGSSVHTKSEEWTRLLATRRTAAIAHAKAMIELFIGEDNLDTTTTSSADFPRYDAAVYEQALWLLQKQDREAENRATALKSTENQLPTAALQTIKAGGLEWHAGQREVNRRCR